MAGLVLFLTLEGVVGSLQLIQTNGISSHLAILALANDAPHLVPWPGRAGAGYRHDLAGVAISTSNRVERRDERAR